MATDEVLDALSAVEDALVACREHIANAELRALTLREGRARGEPYSRLLTGVDGPLVVESLSAMLAVLSDAGGTFRRAFARAVYAEGLSMDTVARLLGVSRQRVSSLLRPSLPVQREPVRRRREGLLLTDPEFRALAESIPHLVWVAGADGATEYVNTQCTDYTGEPRDASYGWAWVDLVHPDDAERAAAAWRHAVETETPFDSEYRLRRADGAYRTHLLRALPVRDPDGAVTKWIGTATDVER